MQACIIPFSFFFLAFKWMHGIHLVPAKTLFPGEPFYIIMMTNNFLLNPVFCLYIKFLLSAIKWGNHQLKTDFYSLTV
jgi:hypothetical protein